MKRLAYVFNSGYAPEETGVIKKIISQCNSFKKLGYDVSMHQINKYKDSVVDCSSMCFSHTKGAGINCFNKLACYRSSIKRLIKEIELKAPYIIYIRDPLWSFDLYPRLSKIAPVFVEVQSKAMDELKLLDRKRYIIEKLSRRSYFKYITGLVCITREISEYEMRFNNKPAFILGNGVDSSDIKHQPREGDGRIGLVFIGSPGESWHGIDRLIDSFLKSGCMDRFNINIIGCENPLNIRCDNITFHGYLPDSEAINRIIRSCDIGVGTLALFRKNMNEAAPLKVRQYIASGLPVIIGYDDTDLAGGLPFVMKVANDNSPIDFSLINQFCCTSRESRINGTICGFAEKKLSWDEKVKKLACFIESTIAGKGTV